MNFEELWKSLKSINDFVGMETLNQKKKFLVKYQNDEIIIVPESTHIRRNLSKDEFFTIWKKFQTFTNQEQYKSANYQKLTRNGSYIIALMNHFLEKDKTPLEKIHDNKTIKIIKKTYDSHPFNEGKDPDHYLHIRGTYEKESRILERIIWGLVGIPVFIIVFLLLS